MCLGIPGKIIEIVDVEKKLAKVDVSGVRRQISVACIISDEAPIEECLGAWVIVHVGFAIARIDEDEAQKTLDLLRELGEAQQELDAMKQQSVG